MGREHKPETVWRAQELYCVDRLSFARVAEIVGTSPTTLKAWARKFHWAAKREEIARAESEIRVNIIRSRKAALEQLLAASEPKEAAPMAFAVASLENLALKREELAAAGKIPGVSRTTRRKIVSRADAIAALRDAVEEKINRALGDPGAISSASVQDIKRCLELVGELEAGLPKDAEAEASGRRGLSGDMAQSIYRALGISNTEDTE